MDRQVTNQMDKKGIYRSILHFYFQEYIFRLPVDERRKFIARGLIGKIWSVFITIYLNLKRTIRAKRIMTLLSGGSISGKKWVFVFGKTNYDATKFLSGQGFVFVTDSVRSFEVSDQIFELPLRIGSRYYFDFFSLLAYLLKEEGNRAWKIADAVFYSLGWYEAFLEVLERYRPQAIILSNDHSLAPRALFYAARTLNIPTIYIQHASISKYISPLEFDLSLLEGKDAFEKYESKGIKGEVKLIGMPRFDPYIKLKRIEVAKQIRVVGIAYNTVDSLEKIASLTRLLKREIPSLTIIVRYHPKDKRDITKPFESIRDLFTLSDSKTVSPFQFILQCDLIVAGDSSIHLEAKMLNIESIYLDLSSEKANLRDLYGYLDKGLIYEMLSEQDVVAFVRGQYKASQGRSSPGFYNEALGSSFESQSSQLALREIQKFLDKNLEVRTEAGNRETGK